MAPLAAAVSSTSERRAKRVLADRLILVFLVIKRSLENLVDEEMKEHGAVSLPIFNNEAHDS